MFDKVKYNKEYNEKNYEIIRFRVKIGQKEKLIEYAKEKYGSLNAYMNELIKKDMGDEWPGGVINLPLFLFFFGPLTGAQGHNSYKVSKEAQRPTT